MSSRPATGLRLLEVPEGSESVFHQYTVLTERRDELHAYLAERGIGTAVHYPEALHLQEAFADLPAQELPVASAAGRRMFPELRTEEVDRVCEAVRVFFRIP